MHVLGMNYDFYISYVMWSSHEIDFYCFHFAEEDLDSERLRVCIENIVYKQQSYDLTPGLSDFT